MVVSVVQNLCQRLRFWVAPLEEALYKCLQWMSAMKVRFPDCGVVMLWWNWWRVTFIVSLSHLKLCLLIISRFSSTRSSEVSLFFWFSYRSSALNLLLWLFNYFKQFKVLPDSVHRTLCMVNYFRRESLSLYGPTKQRNWLGPIIIEGTTF